MNKEVYSKEFHWQEGEFDVYRSCHWSAPGCHNSCGMLYYVKDGKLDHVEGDPNQPYNKGRLCMRCINLSEAANHPDRLKYPLKRAGERGEGKWERISWDEAYDIIEENVRKIWDVYGPESICGMIGTGRNVCWQNPLVCYAAFGTPNMSFGFLSGDSCMVPRTSLSFCVCGDLPVLDASQFNEERWSHPEYRYPEVVLVWGNNVLKSNGDGFFGHWLVEMMAVGKTKLIVVDPDLTWLAAHSEIHIQPRPGSDGAIILAMINTIITEDLYDYEFVNLWCHGFDQLATRASEWSCERAGDIAWVDPEVIRDAARLFAKAKPGALQWGLTTDMRVNGISEAHGLMALNAICGNIETPGGNYLARESYHMNLAYQCGYFENLDAEMRAKRIGDDMSPMHQFGLSATASSDCVLQAIETGEPYPIKMLWFQGNNTIANMGAEAPRIYEAIRSTEFNVVVDVFMTPTAVACADIVLPCGMSHERNSLRTWWTPLRAISKLTQYYEAKSDEQIILDLGKRLNPDAWPYETDIDLLNARLIEGGVPYDFKALQERVYDWQPLEYNRHVKGLLRPDGQPGFNTPTGRIELFCTTLQAFGNDPLPHYEEPPESPISTPELFREYPLVLTTGHRSYEFFHSEHRQLPLMREFHPDPLVDINPKTAAKYGIEHGQWVWIENQRGRCRQKANLSPGLKEDCVNAEHGWWFPERSAENLFDVFDSNINNLTTMMVVGDTGYGAPYKGLLCKVYPCTAENSEIMPTKQVTQLGGWEYERVKHPTMGKTTAHRSNYKIERPFPATVINAAFERAGGCCECRDPNHIHGAERCNTRCSMPMQGSPAPGGFEAMPINPSGPLDIENCHIVCSACLNGA
jgi:anaerobic selenocysteine-containing dehydrogenase